MPKQSKEPIQLHPKSGKAAKAKSGKPAQNTKKVEKRANAFKRFLGETRAEFKKIIWPTRHQVAVNTLVVVVTMVIIGAVVMALDSLCITGFNALVK